MPCVLPPALPSHFYCVCAWPIFNLLLFFSFQAHILMCAHTSIISSSTAAVTGRVNGEGKAAAFVSFSYLELVVHWQV